MAENRSWHHLYKHLVMCYNFGRKRPFQPYSQGLNRCAGHGRPHIVAPTTGSTLVQHDTAIMMSPCWRKATGPNHDTYTGQERLIQTRLIRSSI